MRSDIQCDGVPSRDSDRAEVRRQIDRCIQEIERCKVELCLAAGSVDNKNSPKFGCALGVNDWAVELMILQGDIPHSRTPKVVHVREPLSMSPLQRFVDSIRRTKSGCWEWMKSTTPRGYGHFWDGGNLVRAHRWAYVHIGGLAIPDGHVIDHLCRNHGCVNPLHLEAVTQQVNVLRGEARPAMQAKQADCIHGHPLSGSNLYIKPNGARQCVECRRATDKRRYERANTKGRLLA